MKAKRAIYSLGIAFITTGAVQTQSASLSPPGSFVPITVDNFIRAESDRAFAGIVQQNGFGKFNHSRQLTPLDKQLVPRQNRDTLYSSALFDLDAGPVTITLPDAGRRFMTLMTIRTADCGGQRSGTTWSKVNYLYLTNMQKTTQS